MSLHADVTGVILAGGLATRMGGVDKGALALGSDASDTPAARTLELFATRFPACVIVGASAGTAPWRQGAPDLVYVTDVMTGCGPLGGIHAALGVVPTPFAFVCGCDMPSLSGPLIDLMARRARPGRLLVPVRGGMPEPLHAIYPASCLPAVESALKEGTRKMSVFFEKVPVDYLLETDYAGVPGALRSFDNINTPEDLARLRP